MNLFTERLKTFFAEDLHQLSCIAPRNASSCGRLQHAGDNLAVAKSNTNFISGFNGMRGFCRVPIQQDKARVAKFLGQGAARAKSA